MSNSNLRRFWFWQILFVLLCIWDTIGTQTIIYSNIALEGNPIMDSVIAVKGWAWVWVIKVGLGVIFAWSIPKLWQYLWWKVVVAVVFLWYSFAALIHVFLLYYL